ncbi:Protein N-terminal and lysine N-methyltransferase efm7 [Tilletia horrida]|nr:Protein N-terminal and lysine N-methyltransferase efm7 [Tilletia horrida]
MTGVTSEASTSKMPQDRPAHDAEIENEDEEQSFDMFQEPDTFRPGTPPNTKANWELRIPGSTAAESETTIPISMTLVGHSPLWGHLLWPASQHLSSYLAEPVHRARFVQDKSVLELGAAAGVPSIACAILGAHYVCSTDYPDPDLIRVLASNVEPWGQRQIEIGGQERRTGVVETVGYRWGADVGEVLEHLSRASATQSDSEKPYFNTVILSDLIFNHQAHEALLDTCERTTYTPPGWTERWADRRREILHNEKEEKGVAVDEDGEAIYASMKESTEAVVSSIADVCPTSPNSTVLVSFTHHRPVLAHRDLAFFARARTLGWECAKVGEWACEPVFKDDVGDLKKRSTVHAWAMWRI